MQNRSINIIIFFVFCLHSSRFRCVAPRLNLDFCLHLTDNCQRIPYTINNHVHIFDVVVLLDSNMKQSRPTQKKHASSFNSLFITLRLRCSQLNADKLHFAQRTTTTTSKPTAKDEFSLCLRGQHTVNQCAAKRPVLGALNVRGGFSMIAYSSFDE